MPVLQLKTKTPPPTRKSLPPLVSLPHSPPSPSQPSGVVRNANEFCDRLAEAAPGEVIPYYVGLLGFDRYPGSRVLSAAARLELNVLANRALQLAEAGRVDLVQRRIEPERFDYLAIVRHWPRQQRNSLRAVLPPGHGECGSV